MMVLHHHPHSSSSSSSSTTEPQHPTTTTSTANSGSSTPTASSSSTTSSNTMRAAALRKRRSKGMTGFSSSGGNNNTEDVTTTSLVTTTGGTTTATTSSTSSAGQNTSGRNDRPVNNNSSETRASATAMTTTGKTTTTTTTTTKRTITAHSAPLVLLCAHNAIRMGARTLLNLCPPGRARRALRMALRQQQQQGRQSSQQQQQENDDMMVWLNQELAKLTNLEEYDRAEEEYLWSSRRHRLHHADPNRRQYSQRHRSYSSSSEDDNHYHNNNISDDYLEHDTEEEDDDMSSGDEDDLCDVKNLLLLWQQQSSPDKISSNTTATTTNTINFREPLFPTAADAVAAGGGMDPSTTTPAGAASGAAAVGNIINGNSKLPFFRRKFHYFDMVTAADTSKARTYLEQQMKRSKRHAAVLRLKQQKQKQLERHNKDGDKSAAANSGSDKEATTTTTMPPFEVTRLETPMTPAIAAALLLESLAVNKVESIEGMSKCYDGIVAAGTALLDYDPMTTTTAPPANSSKAPTRSEILAALTPLLITSLERPSGQVIVALSKLRRMCGTFRYQRRFVQRVAPLLVRPPRGAIWCLHHQNDMEAILAATELILDAADSIIFGPGWYERGQQLLMMNDYSLASSLAWQQLDSAAQQLRSFSHDLATSATDDGHHNNAFHLNLSLSSSSAHGTFFGKKRKDANLAAGSAVAASGSSLLSNNEPLEEWEIVAVVQQIKISISGAMTTDWTRVMNQVEVPRPYRRKRAMLQSSSSMEVASPKSSNLSTSPRSPGRPLTFGKPTSSHSPPPGATHQIDSTSASASLENVFGPAFAAQPDRAGSPPPPPAVPTSPPTPHRTTLDRMTAVEGNDALSPNAFPSQQTPPKSPKSPHRDMFRASENVPSMAPLSPKRGKTAKEILGVSSGTTPLSPSTSSVGTSGSNEMVAYKPSSSAGVSSSTHSSTNYRMLTSTAAERKRTVAACRALRAQIQRFEDAFIQLHGRPPKGAAERAPLATTYAQYREWKRAIRADAACRIQALLRGARTRSLLMRKGNPALSRIILKRPGRPGYAGSTSIINQISIPVEIGESSTLSAGPASPVATLSDDDNNNINKNAPTGPALAPHWASAIRRRSNSGDRAAGDNFSGSSPSRRSFPSKGSPSSTGSPEGSNISLEDLQVRKRDLKKQLKQYDINFARRHGRMPVKAEKEPIRHLYESYNSLKNQISVMEQEARSAPAGAPLPAVPLPRTDSPSGGSDSGQSAGPDDSPGRAGLPTVRGRRRAPRESSASSQASVSTSGSSTTSNNTSQDLQSLRVEKTQLHQMLRAYERDFYEEHNRQVSSFSDIRPVASQYRRYKEIKRAIAALQQQSGEH